MSSSIDREHAVSASLSQKPFLFETSFDEANGELLPDAAGREPQEPQYGEAELEQAKQEAFEAGRKAALEEETLRVGQRLAANEEKIAGAIGGLLEERQTLEQQLTREASEATLLMLRKLFPRLSEKESLAEVEALIDGCLERVRQEPRIVVRVSNEQVEKITARVEALARARAYEGKIVVLADETLAPGDALVEWADGGAKRDCGRLMQEMDAAIGRAQFLLDAGSKVAAAGDNKATKETPHG